VSGIDLSVVLTLVDHDGHAAECVESWVRRQDLPRDRYEVIVVASGREQDVEKQVEPLLAPGDRLLRLSASEELELHDHGARAAQGRWLVFTEAHTVAVPGCLSSAPDAGTSGKTETFDETLPLVRPVQFAARCRSRARRPRRRCPAEGGEAAR
jgi:hypothetical protein